MKSVVLWALVAINALLLVSFVNRISWDNAAMAQPAPARRPGDYLMIAGDVTGASTGIVYVVDTTNAKLSALTYDENAKRIVSMRAVDLTAVFQLQRNQPQPQPQPRGNR